jgi:hypothetical protein
LECGNSLPLCGGELLAKSGSLLPGNRQGSNAAWARIRIPAFPGGKPPGAAAGRHLKAVMNRRTPSPAPHDRFECRKGYHPQFQLRATDRVKPGIYPKTINELGEQDSLHKSTCIEGTRLTFESSETTISTFWPIAPLSFTHQKNQAGSFGSFSPPFQIILERRLPDPGSSRAKGRHLLPER